MDKDNPFAQGGADTQRIINQGGDREPAALEPIAILSRCWEIALENPGTVAGAFLIPAIPSVCFQVVQQVLQTQMEHASEEQVMPFLAALIGLALVSGLIQLFFQIGMVRIYTRLARGLPGEVSMLFSESRNYLPALIASFINMLAVMTGLLLFIIPGFIVALGLQFYLYALVDQELDPVAALQESWRLTDGYKFTLFVIGLALGFIVLALVCVTCGFGAILFAPILAMSQGVIYHSLLHLHPKQGVL